MKWEPADLSAADVAFPASVKNLMPPYEDIPREFTSTGNKWVKFQQDWFFSGLANLTLAEKEGIDKTKALRHLSAIQGSFEPKHEHKEAAVAYLASLWFDDVNYDLKKAVAR